MAFFLSYSSHDDKDPKKWVLKFHTDLQKRLTSLSGKPIKIMLDRYDLEDNIIGKGLEEMLDQTQALLTIVSPSYLEKEWCAREREMFISSLKKKFPGENPEERVFVALKLPKITPHTPAREHSKNLPEILAHVKHFKFYQENEFGHAQELTSSQKDFKDQLNALAHTLINFLDKTTRPSVYLAQTNVELDKYRYSLYNELVSKGFSIYPKISLDSGGSSWNNDLDKMMSKCLLSIHFVDPRQPLVEESFDLQQIKAAQSKGLPVLIWCPKGIPKVDGVTPPLDEKSDFIECTFQEFNNDVFEKLNEISNVIHR
jgi:hypothetical protein